MIPLQCGKEEIQVFKLFAEVVVLSVKHQHGALKFTMMTSVIERIFVVFFKQQ